MKQAKKLVAIFVLSQLAFVAAVNAGVECVAKRQVSDPGASPVYNESTLSNVFSAASSREYSATVRIDNCFFSAKSDDSEIFNLSVYQNPEDSGSQSYGTFDPMGRMIATFTNSRANLLCMIVCNKR